MEKFQNTSPEEELWDSNKLKELILKEPNTMSLTAVRMALKCLDGGNVDSAIDHLRSDADKLTNRELREYIRKYKFSNKE